MKLWHKNKSYLFKIVFPLVFLAGAISSFIVYAETIEQVSFYDKPIYTFRGKTPHVSMPISSEFPISASAWNYPRVPYANLPTDVKLLTNKEIYVTQKYQIGNNEYIAPLNTTTKFARFTDPDKASPHLGYFNHQLCYSYNTSDGGYFQPIAGSDGISCGSNFSGNYMNWVSMTTLDLIRYALTGGSRDLDLPNKTILKRARVAEHDEIMVQEVDKEWTDRGIDFRSTLVPTKYTTVSNVVPSTGHTYAQNCGKNIYFSDIIATLYPRDKYQFTLLDKLDEKGNVITKLSCDDLKETQFLKKYSMRIEVCTAEDARLRPEYCQIYPSGNYKPVGALQKNTFTRFSLLSYLNVSPSLIQMINAFGDNPRPKYKEDNVYKYRAWSEELYTYAWGGVLRAPAKFLGQNKYDVKLDSTANNQAEWNPITGELIMDANHKKVGGIITPYASDILFNQNFPNTVKGDEPIGSGTSIINYINEFGFYDTYRNSDHWAELLGEALKYLGNYGASYESAMTAGDESTTREGTYWWHRVHRLNGAANGRDAMMSLTDVFPIVKFWQFSNDKQAVRSQCEKDQTRLVTMADTNNWRQRYETANGWHSTALGSRDSNDDNFFVSKSLRSILGEIDPKLRHISDPYQTTTEKVFIKDAAYMPFVCAPEDAPLTFKQDRYIAASLLAGANLYGINYKNNSNVLNTKVKSIVIDVGEPELDGIGEYLASPEVDCHLYTAGVYGSHSQDEIGKLLTAKAPLVGGSTLCNAWVAARASGDVNKINSLLPSKGYFYPSTPNKIIEGISQSFKIPVSASGNVSGGVTQNLDWRDDGSREVYLFKNNLYTNSNSLDTSISTELKKYELYLDTVGGDSVKSKETSYTKSWESNLKSSLKSNSNRNIILGGAFKKDANGNPILERNAPIKFTYNDITTAGDTEALSNLKIGLSEKVTPNMDINSLLIKKIDYIRGSQADEQTDSDKKLFRKRDFLLGSSGNSHLEYLTAETKYGNNMVYLPSNDGMLHGIDADSGVEKFAYLPRAILPNLYEYSEQGYVDKPLIEGHPTVRVIVPNTQKKYNNPVSVLASGFGSGAKGLFAIDVSPVHNTASNPVTASNVLFEFTEKDDPDMGYVVGQPSFVVLWTGEYTDANGKKRDRDETFVAVTSGYNNLSSKTEYDAEGKPKNKMYLFLLKTDRTYDKAWKEGTCDTCNYRKIEITDSDMKNVTNNGLTTPRIIGYGSRTVYFYMGDLQGNLWRYSYDAKAFTGVSDPYDSDLTVKKVFSSSNEATLRPITSKPTIALSKDGGFMISFGTGRYFGLNDLGSLKRSQQSLITIHDRLGDITLTLSNLNKREMRDGTKVTKVGTDNASNYKNGWYIDFALSKDSGERAIFSPRIKDNTVIFTTQILGKFEDNSCGTNSGSIAYVDLYEGTGGYSVIADKFVGEVIIMPAFKIAGSFNNQQMSTQGGNMLSKTYLLVGGGTDAASSNVPPTSMSINSYAVKGRLSWREIVKSGLQ